MRRKKYRRKTVDGVQCLPCGDVIWSRYGHDFRRCSCGETFVDGGREYLRYGGQSLENIRVVRITPMAAK